MRLLSKYCTRRFSPGEFFQYSRVAVLASGPQYQERPTAWSNTSLSVRVQTFWNAGERKGVPCGAMAGALGGCAAGRAAAPGTSPVNSRTGIRTQANFGFMREVSS